MSPSILRGAWRWGLLTLPVLSLAAVVVLAGPASAQAPTQSVGPARPYTMPTDRLAPYSGPPVEAPRPRVPDPEALERLKRLPGAPSEGPPTPQRKAPPSPLALQTTCNTNSAGGSAPSDIHGAAGPTNIVVTTNTDVGVYDKTTCSAVSLVSLKTFFGSAFTIPANESLFDPQVVYDPAVGRFFLSAESCVGSCDTSPVNQYQYYAVSQDNTGTSWHLYRIIIHEGATIFCVNATTTFWDYPKNGWINGSNPRWFITSNNFPASGPVTSGLISIDKTPTLTGAATTAACISNALQVSTIPPLVQDGSDTGYFLAPGSGSGSQIVRYALTTNAAGPGSDSLAATTPIGITAWTAPPNAAQPNGELLDSLDGRFQGASVQVGTTLWNVHAINVGGFARWRLYQLSTTGTSPLFAFNTTSVGGNNDHLFNPSLAVNATTAFVTASRTIPSDAANGNAAMLMFHGANGSAAGWAFDLVATSAQQFTGCGGGCRWGDYSATQIDPSNNSAAWGFNQLVTGTSQFSWTTRAALVGAGVATATHDFNGDGKSDIAWRHDTGTAAIWLMNALLVSQSGSLGMVPTNWQIVGQRDFNGDGKHDWLWRDGTTGTVAIWLLNALQVLSSGGLGVVPGNWGIVGTGDFDGDGKGDILWRDGNTGTVAIWLLNGLQVSSSGSLGVVPANWAIAGSGDFNGDGKADILWRDNTSGTVAIWFLNGLQVTSSGSLGVVPAEWVIAGTGDFDGDGKSDILWRNTTTGAVAIWLLNALQVTQSGGLGTVPADWTIPVTGDFDGDGKSDLLWRNTASGVAAIWFLSGLQVSSSGSIGTVGLDWTIQGLNAD